MKTRLFLLPFICSTMLSSSTTIKGQTVVTFDDLPLNTDTASAITNGYQGLSWSNFWAWNAILVTRDRGPNGYYNGMLSVSNVAFNGLGNPAEIDASGSNFNFLSAYLTGAWNSNLNVEVQGFRSGILLYDTTVVVRATSPNLITFNYSDVDRLYFNSFGGQNAGFALYGEQFVMDNFTIEFIPEPSSLLLTVFGAATLFAVVRRKRA